MNGNGSNLEVKSNVFAMGILVVDAENGFELLIHQFSLRFTVYRFIGVQATLGAVSI